jgi:hypothetical protein
MSRTKRKVPVLEKGKHSIPAAVREEGTPPDPFDFEAKEREGGKESLPNLEDLESEYADEPEDESEPDFTEEDKADLSDLEGRVSSGCRTTFAALREIRNRKLWQLHKDEDGNRLYKSFAGKTGKSYVKTRFGFTSQWVTRGLNWLRVMETFDRLGVEPPPLSVDAAQALNPDHLKRAGGLLAVFKEAQEDGLTLTLEHLKQIVDRRSEFFGGGEEKPAAKSYEDFRRDILVVERLPQEGASPSAVVNAILSVCGDEDEEDEDFDADRLTVAKALERYGDKVDAEAVAEELLVLCENYDCLPDASDLLLVFSGQQLEDVVSELETLATDRADTKRELAELEQWKAEKKKLLEADHLKTLTEKIKARTEALEKQGVLKSKPKPATDGNGKGGSAEASGPKPAEAEVQKSKVREKLDLALKHVNEALESAWPDAPAENEELLEVVKDIQKALEAVAKKATDVLAEARNTPQPAAIPTNS